MTKENTTNATSELANIIAGLEDYFKTLRVVKSAKDKHFKESEVIRFFNIFATRKLANDCNANKAFYSLYDLLKKEKTSIKPFTDYFASLGYLFKLTFTPKRILKVYTDEATKPASLEGFLAFIAKEPLSQEQKALNKVKSLLKVYTKDELQALINKALTSN